MNRNRYFIIRNQKVCGSILHNGIDSVNKDFVCGGTRW